MILSPSLYPLRFPMSLPSPYPSLSPPSMTPSLSRVSSTRTRRYVFVPLTRRHLHPVLTFPLSLMRSIFCIHVSRICDDPLFGFGGVVIATKPLILTDFSVAG